MTTDLTPDKPRSVAPGMEMVIVAGESYDIADESGQGLALIGQESPWAMEFLRAYDAWESIFRTLGATHEQTLASWKAVEDKWAMMPTRLVKEMPSYRAGGIIVPGGG
jgi:hypothetical protein